MKLPLLTISAVVLLIALPVRAEDDVDRFAKHVKTSPAELRAAGAAKALSGDPGLRRAFLLETAQKAPPHAAALPLLVHLAQQDEDPKVRLAALKLVGHVGVVCDRDALRAIFFPELRRRMTVEKAGPEERAALEETIRLARFFKLDQEVSRDLDSVYKGSDFVLRSIAFQALAELAEPSLDEKLVRPACFTVLDATAGFSVFDRRCALREIAKRQDKNALARATAALGEGPLAIEAASAFGELGDARGLDALRGIDRTASHGLRAEAFRARARLDDARLPDELAAFLGDDNAGLLERLIESLGEMRSDAPKKLLESLAQGKLPAAREERRVLEHHEDELEKERRRFKRAAGLALLARGEAPGLDVVKAELASKDFGQGELEGLAAKVMRLPHATGLVVTVLEDARFGDTARLLAAGRAGEEKLADALPLLEKIAADETLPVRLRLEARASRYELGAKDALGDLLGFMKDHDDVVRNDEEPTLVDSKVKLHRYAGSALVPFVERLEKKKEEASLEVFLELLAPETAPIGTAAPAKPAAGKTDGKTDGKTVSKPAAKQDPKPSPGARRARDQFLRARAVVAAARVAGPKAAKVLARGLADPMSEVRAAALREIGRLSGKFTLPLGADASEETKATKLAQAWLGQQGE
jgi:HEAT repeat protein